MACRMMSASGRWKQSLKRIKQKLKLSSAVCFAVVKNTAKECPLCGYEFKPQERAEREVIDDVILQEISRRPYDDYKKCKTFFELDIFRRAKKYKFAWSLHKAVELKIQIPDKYKWMAYRMGLIA